MPLRHLRHQRHSPRLVTSALVCLSLLMALSACGARRATPQRIDAMADWILALDATKPALAHPLTVIIAGPTSLRLVQVPPQAPIRDQERVPVGSVTKVLTALLVLQAVDEGRIRLDDHLPELDHPTGEAVTWRHLLEHRAGYVDKLMDPTLPEAGVPIVPPGILYLYSNEGYAALANALEGVTGQPLGQLARSRVFTPLGMEDVRLGGQLHNGDWSPPLGASGLEGSREELALLAKAIAQRDQRILSRRGWETLFGLELWDRVQSSAFDEPKRVGLVQQGRVTGSRSSLVVLPKARGTVMVLFAEDADDTSDLAETMTSRIQTEAIRRLGDRPSLLRLSNLNPVRLFRSEACRQCDWSDREGTYVSSRTGEQFLVVELNGGPTLIEDDGATRSIGPELTDGRSRFHDLYEPITDATSDALLHAWPRRTGSPDVIEFGERDGRVVGLLCGAEWYDKMAP